MFSIRKFLIAALCVGMVSAQCNDDVVIESDGDVSKLQNCAKLDGKVTFGTKVTSVAFPSTLTSITGDLVVSGARQLVSLEAPGLRTIGGSFTLKELTILSTLSFPELVSVSDINWVTLPALQSLTFTKQITSANTVLITDTLLTSLNGISLSKARRFNINNNRYLRNIDLPLGNVSDILIIDANGRGLNASFPELTWANNITIRDASDIYFPVLKAVNSSLLLINDTFASATFPELVSVGESLAFVSCSKLTKIDANQLETIGGTFQIANNTKLAKVDGFKSLTQVGGAVDLSGVFTKVELPSLDDVRGGFNLQSTQDIDCEPFKTLKANDAIKGDGFVCAGKKETAESKTGGLGTTGSGSGKKDSSASSVGFSSVILVAVAGVAAFMAL